MIRRIVLCFILILLPAICFAADQKLDRKQIYELQEKCERRAKERFKEEFNFMDYTYQNHYNKKMNKCFMWVWSLDGARTQYLYDVNENQHYGMIIIGDKNIRCQLLNKYCTSEAEWDAFIKPYMEE
jgi:hypothetical protein